jgi:NADH dehydrogenase (ubiquinone) Fe-S protein 1
LLNADDFTPGDYSSAFVIYQGHHGDVGAQSADVILPGSAFTEKSATFVNTEGRSQVTRAAVVAPGAARDDWQIIRALSEFCQVPLEFDDLTGVRKRMSDVAPNLVEYDHLDVCSFPELGLKELGLAKGPAGSVGCAEGDFYQSNVICRASSTMAKCTRSFTNLEDVKVERLVAV